VLIWKCVYQNGPLASPVIAGHDLSAHDGHFTCTPYTYNDLLEDEVKFARVLGKALEYVHDLPPVG
jgi:hypothetical protein